MDDLSDLPPLQPYIKKRPTKQEPSMPKILLPTSPQKKAAQTTKPFPEPNASNNSLQKSNGPSPPNTSKQFPNSASSMLRQNQPRIQTRKNRIQKTTKTDKQQRLVQQLDDKELLRGRRMINNMINKTGTKNMITEAQTSIETINKNIEELNKEIELFEEKINEMDYLISNDPNNGEHEERRKELVGFVEKLETTNRLYKEQIDMRTENKSLMEKIQKLKQENMEIKGRVIEGLEKIEGHMHNLPCEREKSALIELEKVKKELERERKMREDLENRVQGTIQDFSRLYEEADLARKIIVGKLRRLEITEEQLECGFVVIEQLKGLNPGGEGAGGKHHPVQPTAYHHHHQSNPPVVPPPVPPQPSSITEDRALQQSPRHSQSNGGSRMVESIGKQEGKSNMGESTMKRDSVAVRNRNLAEKVGMMRGNMETFKKMKF